MDLSLDSDLDMMQNNAKDVIADIKKYNNKGN